ncbi:hypothetical protein HFP72_34845 [Nocardiopsis sp. ARC36]
MRWLRWSDTERRIVCLSSAERCDVDVDRFEVATRSGPKHVHVHDDGQSALTWARWSWTRGPFPTVST